MRACPQGDRDIGTVAASIPTRRDRCRVSVCSASATTAARLYAVRVKAFYMRMNGGGDFGYA